MTWRSKFFLLWSLILLSFTVLGAKVSQEDRYCNPSSLLILFFTSSFFPSYPLLFLLPSQKPKTRINQSIPRTNKIHSIGLIRFQCCSFENFLPPSVVGKFSHLESGDQILKYHFQPALREPITVPILQVECLQIYIYHRLSIGTRQ